MNYEKIHNDLIQYCQNSEPRDRLIKRKPTDERLCGELYTERHHIIPKHSGGTDADSNLVILLPEEHYLIHLLRFKAFDEPGDFIATRFIVNGYIAKTHVNHKPIALKIGRWKHHIQTFRKSHGWHTEDGIRRIAEARTKTSPVKCARTGVKIGAVDKRHPKILSGEWVHHSKGMGAFIDENGEKVWLDVNIAKSRNLISICKIEDRNKGSNNPNFKEMTDSRKQRLFSLVPDCIIDNHLSLSKLESAIKLEFTEFKKVGYTWVKNNLGELAEFISMYNALHGTSYQYRAGLRINKGIKKIYR